MRSLFYELGYLFSRGSKWGALISFLLSLISAISQVAAFVMIAIFVRLLEKNADLNFFGLNIPAGEKSLIVFTLIIPLILIVSLLLKLHTLTWITNEGRKFFDNLSEFTFTLSKRYLFKNKILNPTDISAMIKYDVRYASISYMHVLRIFYPLFVSIGILAFAHTFEPLLTNIIAFSIILMLPFHFLLIKWGSNTADRIREGAVERSKDIDRAISDVFSHPNNDSILLEQNKTISQSTGNLKFMKAYVDRQRLSGFSAAISDITMLIAVVIISWIALDDTISGVLTISNLILGFIIFKFLMSNTSLLLQSITSIGALQPFFRDLLKFISPKSQIFEEIIFSGFPLDSAPFTLSVVSFNSFSPSTAIAISKAIDANSQVAVLTASFNLNELQSWKLQLNTNYDDFRKRLDKCDKDNNPAFTQIDGFLKEAEVVTKSAPKTWERLSIAARLIFLAVLIPDDTDTVVLNGTDCQSLSDANWKTLNKIISGRSVIFVYNKCPRRLRFGKEGQIAVMNQDTIEIFENRNFTALIKEINAQQISQVATKDRSKDLEYAI